MGVTTPSLQAIASCTLREASTRNVIVQGIKRALPMAAGYAPVGFAFAAVALASGMPRGLVLLMSALVYACSSQVVAVQLLLADATLMSIMITTFVVNLRHVLMASVLAPHLRAFRKRHLAVFAFQMCDEAFALHSEYWQHKPANRMEAICVNGVLYASWFAGNALAVAMNVQAHHMTNFGLDFAPLAMFMGLLAILIKNRLQLVIALLCGAAAVVLRMHGLGAWSIILATLMGATMGLGWKQWTRRKKYCS